MNLGDVLNKALSYAPGNRVSEALTGSPLFGSSGHLSSWLNKKTGAALTGAEREANAFNAEQSQLAFERVLSADSSKYQRSVADMQAAGLNPMLAASGSIGGSVNASPASSVSPVAENLGSVLSFAAQMRSLSIQDRLAKAEIANKTADTAKKQSETASVDLANVVTQATQSAEIESRNLKPSLTRSNIRLLDKKLDEIDATVSKLVAEAKTEEEKKMYYNAAAILQRVTAYNAAEMLPYQRALASAQTVEARQAAALSAISAAYKQGLIDNGYIESFAREMAANAGLAENSEKISDIKTALRTGDYSKTEAVGSLKKDFTSRLLQSLTVALDNLNPLNNILK